MGEPAKPFPLGKTIAVGLGLAVMFLVLSLFFLFLQARGTEDRMVGEVVAIAGQSVTIRNARGTETVLIIAPDANLRGVPSVADIVEGQHIMTRGKFNDADVFEVDGLRIVRDFDQR